MGKRAAVNEWSQKLSCASVTYVCVAGKNYSCLLVRFCARAQECLLEPHEELQRSSAGLGCWWLPVCIVVRFLAPPIPYDMQSAYIRGTSSACCSSLFCRHAVVSINGRATTVRLRMSTLPSLFFILFYFIFSLSGSRVEADSSGRLHSPQNTRTIRRHNGEMTGV